jgi:hypothetical protein
MHEPEHPQPLLGESPRDALAEGAQRFSALIERVRARPASSEHAVAPLARNPLLAISPAEEWTRQFQSRDLAAGFSQLPLGDLAAVPRDALMPEPVIERSVVRPDIAGPVVPPQELILRAGGLPRAPQRRSWLARLFGQRDAAESS